MRPGPHLHSVILAIFYSVGIAAFILLALPGCTSLARPVLVPKPDTSTTSVIEATSIYILQPLLFYEDVQTEHEKELEHSESDRVSRKILEEIEGAALSKGFAPVNDSDLDVVQQAAVDLAMEMLRRNKTTLFKTHKRIMLTKETLGSLSNLLDLDLVLASFLRVKVGRGESWDLYSGAGAIYPGTSTSQLWLAIIDLRHRQVVWTNEVFARRGPSQALLGRILEMALSSFPESRR